MEQIKRMLVNQRGFIVQALKQMTEANTANREVREKFVDQIKVYIYNTKGRSSTAVAEGFRPMAMAMVAKVKGHSYSYRKKVNYF